MPAAESGYAKAQNLVGEAYHKKGSFWPDNYVDYGKEDFEKAEYWWNKAAEGGDIDAKHNLAYYYRIQPSPYTHNPERALEFLLDIIDKIDSSDCEYENIADLYAELGDVQNALIWYEKIENKRSDIKKKITGLKNGRRSGEYFFSNHDMYNGDLDGKGLPHGHGVLKFAYLAGTGHYRHKDVPRWEGEWEHGQKSSVGVWYLENGSFAGEVDDEQLPHGEGTFTYNNGDTCKGEFVHGACNGHCVYNFCNNERFEGDFSNGKAYQGEYYYKNGDRHQGKFKKWVCHGEGTRYYANGDSESGYWKDGNLEGKTTYVYKNGTSEERTYMNGERSYPNNAGTEKASDEMQARRYYAQLATDFVSVLKKAENGDAAAMYAIAVYHKTKFKDDEQFYNWASKAADGGFLLAQQQLCMALGDKVMDMDGSDPRVQTYFKWIKKFAKEGDAKSQYILACLYSNGIGCEQDAYLALSWLKSSAEKGVEEAIKVLKEMN